MKTKVRRLACAILFFAFSEVGVSEIRLFWYSAAQLGNHEGIWIVAVK